MSDASNATALIKEAFDNAVVHHQAGRLSEAEELYRAILELNPQHPDANHNLGVLAVQLKQVPASLHFFKTALAAKPGESRFWHSYIEALNAAGETTAAQEVLTLSRQHGISMPAANPPAIAATAKLPPRATSTQKPAQAEMQGIDTAFRKQDWGGLEKLARALTEKYPDAIEGWKALSLAGYYGLRYEQALVANRKMVDLHPEQAQTHADLGLILWRLRRLDEAEASFLHALAIDSKVSDTHTNLGNVYKDQGRIAEAMHCYRRAIELDPKQAVPYSNLGVLLLDVQHFRDAETCLRTALKLEPDNAFVLRNLSTALAKLGQLTEAEAVIRQAIAVEPENVLAYDLLLFLFNYTHIDQSQEGRKLAEHYGRLVASKRERRYTEWSCLPDPQRLKVGLVSSDLHNHPVGHFVESLVANFDSTRIELIAYVHMSEHKCDEVTQRLQPHFSAWKSIYRLRDSEAATLIHEDGIHVLLDLSGHTSDNRLPVFAWKPAPVQASWLGYFATTGVAEMDYLIGDPWLCPPQEEEHFTEAVWRLPRTWLSFTPPQEDVPVAPLPALRQGHITFGSFNNLNKMNDAVVALWAQLLHRLPESRLLLKAPQLRDAEVRTQILARFSAQGIQAERLTLEGHSPRREYLQAYANIDIALDPFPYPGGATSVDALWMGVPVLTQRGNRFLAHLGESIAHNAGLSDWIAADSEDFLAKAVSFATDLPALSALRVDLRTRLHTTPLLDNPGFAQGFNDALWQMWTRHATGPAPTVRPASNPTPLPQTEAERLQRLFRERKFKDVEKLGKTLLKKYPQAPQLLRMQALARYHDGRLDDALQTVQTLIQTTPDDAAAYATHGLVLIGLQRLAEAQDSLAHAIRLDPDSSDPHINLAYIHRQQGRLDEAAACYRTAIAIHPNLVAAHANLGVILLEQQTLRAAESSFRSALSLAANHGGALLGLASVLVKLGALDEAEAVTRRLIRLEPDNVQAYDILLFMLNYRNTHYSPEALELAVRYGKVAARKADKRHSYTVWRCDPSPERLRIGLVSADLYNHPVGYFLEGLLRELDTNRVEVFVYANRPEYRNDTMSARLRSHCAGWRSIHGASDAAAAATIHADGIHILIDLAGHTGDTRLPVFAYKPAPVQAAWLGYFATTGVAEIDYLIGDPNVCPPEEEGHFTETVWRLPETYLCFTPPDVDVATNTLPALENAGVTFGCFNNIGKLNDSVVATWCQILQRVPNSRLLLKARQLGDPAVCEQLRKRFSAHGISDEQLILEGPTPRKDYLQSYQRVDIVLDPFPYPGGTTTMEALWMSVPVLTLRGNRMLSHAGENILRNVGLPDWIATDTADYVAKAVSFAADIKSLSALRGHLRAQALASPMFDAPRFARHFEEALWGMWQQKRA
jgi:predicted O-linked N-acetylglucosamine transferase (SPINDLY family)